MAQKKKRQMEEKVRQDIAKVLSEVIDDMEHEHYLRLSELSNHTIHNASIYQDADSISTAIMVYSLAKIVQRCSEKSCPIPVVVPTLKKAHVALMQEKYGTFDNQYKKVFDIIEKHDEHLKMYVEEVMDKAKIKKGHKLHEHGISTGRIAELLGVSQWELYSYMGKTTESALDERKIKAKTRLGFAREIFE